ncbi:hypothetical protein, partial [Klebsiella pneumoniae]|uniref:hypothetical protein n=1 Tax=Klebsiella pneumoniae TaxID=573 RepID=UPI0022B69D93
VMTNKAEQGNDSGSQATKAALAPCSAERFKKNLPGWQKQISEGGKVVDLLAMLQSKYTLTDEQLDAINALDKQAPADAPAADQAGMDE